MKNLIIILPSLIISIVSHSSESDETQVLENPTKSTVAEVMERRVSRKLYQITNEFLNVTNHSHSAEERIEALLTAMEKERKVKLAKQDYHVFHFYDMWSEIILREIRNTSAHRADMLYNVDISTEDLTKAIEAVRYVVQNKLISESDLISFKEELVKILRPTLFAKIDFTRTEFTKNEELNTVSGRMLYSIPAFSELYLSIVGVLGDLKVTDPQIQRQLLVIVLHDFPRTGALPREAAIALGKMRPSGLTIQRALVDILSDTDYNSIRTRIVNALDLTNPTDPEIKKVLKEYESEIHHFRYGVQIDNVREAPKKAKEMQLSEGLLTIFAEVFPEEYREIVRVLSNGNKSKNSHTDGKGHTWIKRIKSRCMGKFSG